MTSLFRVGQCLSGRLARYTITKQIYRDSVWFAKSEGSQKQVVIKGVEGHARVEKEKEILLQFRDSIYIRQLVDEIQEPANPTTIVLEYLDADLAFCSDKKTLNRKELKFVSKRILQGLQSLHAQDYVHTDVKLMNVLVNLDQGNLENRFTDVKLADLGETSRIDSDFAMQGYPISSSIWRSPEAQFQLAWNTATDIWSFGLCVIALIYGDGINLLSPTGYKVDHDDYEFMILKEQFKFFGPMSVNFLELVGSDKDVQHAIRMLHLVVPPEQRGLFRTISEKEICAEDKVFLSKIMKYDWRDRPSAKQLLEDEWFGEERMKEGHELEAN